MRIVDLFKRLPPPPFSTLSHIFSISAKRYSSIIFKNQVSQTKEQLEKDLAQYKLQNPDWINVETKEYFMVAWYKSRLASLATGDKY